MRQEYAQVFSFVDEEKEKIVDTVHKIWDFAEEGKKEFRSAAHYVNLLKQEGLTVRERVADIETAFMASYGEGSPVIGFLAEYDALAGLSQKADCTYRSPAEGRTWGHGCGHNCLGAGALGAFLAVRDFLKANQMPGTIRLYGCPAEENGGCKAVMEMAGEFHDLDACFTWHPSDVTFVVTGGTLANIGYLFEFFGISAHAAANPEDGRSALDAAELANVGVNYLREHMPDRARIHYAYIDAGNPMPNVVQDYCAVRYFVRAPRAREALALARRLEKIVQGANLMTETTSKFTRTEHIVADYVPNEVLSKEMYEVMQMVPPVVPDEEEKEYLRALQATLGEDPAVIARKKEEAFRQPAGSVDPLFASRPLLYREGADMFGSTDVGNASYAAPTAQLNCALAPLGTAVHTWQFSGCAGSTIAEKGTLYVAKVLAGTAVSVLLKPELSAAAKEELLKKTGGVLLKE